MRLSIPSFVLVLFLWAWSHHPAQAQVPNLAYDALGVVYQSGGGSYVTSKLVADQLNVSRILEAVPNETGAVGVRSAPLAQIGAKSVPMSAVSKIPWSAVAKSIAKATPWVAAAVAAKDIWNSVRARPGANGEPEVDLGVDQETVPGIKATDAGIASIVGQGTTVGEACSSWLGKRVAMLQSTAGGTSTGGTTTVNTYSGSITDTSGGMCSANIVKTAVQCTGGNCSNQTTTLTAGAYLSNTPITQCPASIDFANPANSIAAGSPPGADGKCPTGRYAAQPNPSYLQSKVEAYGDKSKAVDAVSEGVKAGQDYTPDMQTPQLSGPSSVTQAPVSTTTQTPTGSVTTTTNTVNNITYQGNTYNYTTTVTTTTGDTTTTTTSGSGAPAPGEVEVCGLPGKPACKIDETGTPTYTENAAARAAIEALQTTESAKLNSQSTAVDGAAPDFGFLGAPPLAACVPFEFNGKGSIDPCAVVEDGRSVMAYLWALAGAWLCFGFIRGAINGGKA